MVEKKLKNHKKIKDTTYSIFEGGKLGGKMLEQKEPTNFLKKQFQKKNFSFKKEKTNKVLFCTSTLFEVKDERTLFEAAPYMDGGIRVTCSGKRSKNCNARL
ncbi:MAG: hypothetical protein FJZ61_01990 [Chlamydiae bacterium]|nr:hypothetical protein [Chlamydiota bacterium]